MSEPSLRGWLFAFNAVSYLPALVFLLRAPVGRKSPQAPGMPAPYREAWQSLASRPDARLALVVFGIVLFFFTNGAVLQPLIGYRLLGGARAYAWIMTANGVGNLIITIAQAMRESSRRAGAMSRRIGAKGTQLDGMLGWGMCVGLCIVIYGAAFGLLPSISFMLASCWGANFVRVTANILLVQERDGQYVDIRLHGRLNALMQTMAIVCIMLGDLLAVIVADSRGVRAASVGIEAVGVCVVGVVWWFYRHRKS
ncbi:hypothetical protein [Ktedonospora formicarum]|uniref:hypothetical protein n=1 Tax=Ktedonospora formicarum TaxID=2778364 RepID=UPI001C689B51|nr:hypothetical protein [Ktedonospora formicarum]